MTVTISYSLLKHFVASLISPATETRLWKSFRSKCVWPVNTLCQSRLHEELIYSELRTHSSFQMIWGKWMLDFYLIFLFFRSFPNMVPPCLGRKLLWREGIEKCSAINSAELTRLIRPESLLGKLQAHIQITPTEEVCVLVQMCYR